MMRSEKKSLSKRHPPHSSSRAAAPPGILLVGTFVSATLANHSVGEELAGRLAEAGWRVFTTSSKTTRAARLLDMLATVWRLRHRYDVAQVDVYSGRAFLWAEAVCGLLRRLGKPYGLTLRGGNLPGFARRRPRRVRRLFATARFVTTPSRYLFEAMAPYREELVLLPNPLDLDQHVFRVRERPAPRLVWLRAFAALYNPSMAPAVVARLVEQQPDVHLTMIGPDKGDGSLQKTEAAARRLGVEAHLRFPGGVPHAEVPRWLGEGDIFLNTTNADNTPVSVLEAMACGLCVVSTNVGGLPYLLEHEHDALLVPPNDPVAMAAAVQRLFEEPALAERLSRTGRRTVEQFAWKMLLPRWQHLLAACLGEAAPAAAPPRSSATAPHGTSR